MVKEGTQKPECDRDYSISDRTVESFRVSAVDAITGELRECLRLSFGIGSWLHQDGESLPSAAVEQQSATACSGSRTANVSLSGSVASRCRHLEPL